MTSTNKLLLPIKGAPINNNLCETMNNAVATTIASLCCLFSVFGTTSDSCPAGYQCLESSLRSVNGFSVQKPIPCPIGTYSEQGQSECKPCKPGYYTITIASSYCKPCPGGSMCRKPNRKPVPCPLNSYTSCIGQVRCTPCLLGMYTLRTGSTYCIKCPAGKKCNGDPSSK